MGWAIWILTRHQYGAEVNDNFDDLMIDYGFHQLVQKPT